jgi:hypothetical protein
MLIKEKERLGINERMEESKSSIQCRAKNVISEMKLSRYARVKSE